jgi:hypothetical protein
VIVPDRAEKLRFFQELKGSAEERARLGRPYKPNWPDANFRSKYGHWPNNMDHHPALPPSRAVRNWIKSKQIAFAKRRGAA